MRNILFSCLNQSFRAPGLVWLSSLQQLNEQTNFLSDTEVWVFHTPDFNKRGFEQFTFVHWHELPIVEFVNSRIPKRETQGMVMRLQAFDYFYKTGIKRVFYTDADALILKDFRDIYKTALSEETPLAACQDYVYTDDPLIGPLYKKVSFEYAHRMVINKNYFNSGVIYIDLPFAYAKLKQLGESSIMEYFLQNAHRYMFPDQDALNELFPKYIRLPRFFNSYADMAVSKYLTANEAMSARYRISKATIVHFIAKSKPWKVNSELLIERAMVPLEIYWNAAQPVLHLLDNDFVAALKDNLSKYAHIIEHFRITEGFVDE